MSAARRSTTCAHIGNGRAVVVFDLLYRLLRHAYGAEHVRYVRNITDVDDKIIAAARENGETIAALTARTTALFHDDMAALGALPPDVEPRGTEHIPQMIAMIERLIASGHAYAAEGHVLFAVASWPDYGKLSRRSRAGDDRRRPGRGRALQARPRRFRAVEAVDADDSRAGTARGGAAGRAGTSNARR